jgi:ferrochelatase
MARDVPTPRRIAVVLFNLGGPDGQKAVRPFLFNLFRDKAIIAAPAPVRYPLAALISGTRAKAARANYALMGGGSPLLPETERQAEALKAALRKAAPADVFEVFIAMRYWKPLTSETARKVAAFRPDEVVLLPLYPQFSTTTTQSSVAEWKRRYKGSGEVREICCYPRLPSFIEAHAQKIREVLPIDGRPFRLLFSAHGLPEKVIAAGDPYQRQVEATARAVAEALEDTLGGDLDWRVCYQSRVGPLAWIGPSTIEAIDAAAAENLTVVISPIAFVSEHVETLVELDHEYALHARMVGVADYRRAATLGVSEAFIDGLAEATLQVLSSDVTVAPAAGWDCGECGPICPAREGKIA